MYDRRLPEDMDFYRNPGTKVPNSGGASASDKFWNVRQGDEPDWFSVVGGKPRRIRR